MRQATRGEGAKISESRGSVRLGPFLSEFLRRPRCRRFSYLVLDIWGLSWRFRFLSAAVAY